MHRTYVVQRGLRDFIFVNQRFQLLVFVDQSFELLYISGNVKNLKRKLIL